MEAAARDLYHLLCFGEEIVKFQGSVLSFGERGGLYWPTLTIVLLASKTAKHPRHVLLGQSHHMEGATAEGFEFDKPLLAFFVVTN